MQAAPTDHARGDRPRTEFSAPTRLALRIGPHFVVFPVVVAAATFVASSATPLTVFAFDGKWRQLEKRRMTGPSARHDGPTVGAKAPVVDAAGRERVRSHRAHLKRVRLLACCKGGDGMKAL